LIPREHGAWAHLCLPLLVVLLAGSPSWAGACYAVVALFAFLGHEPLLVLLGQRGTRALREHGKRARFRLLWMFGAALGAAGFALQAAPSTLPWALVPLSAAVVAGLFVANGRQRTLAGELTATAALTTAAIPTGIACGLRWPEAVAITGVFWASFAASTVEVRAIAGHPAPLASRAGIWIAVAAIFFVLALFQLPLAASMLPLVLIAIGVGIAHPPASKLRRLGWSLAAASLVTGVLAVISLRVGA